MEQFEKNIERAVLVGLDSPVLGEGSSDWESLEELDELLKTAGGECVASVLQKRPTPDPATFVGEGKALEVKELAENNDAALIVFDNDLSPSRIRNLEKLTGKTVLDRSALILDIFAQRARTSEGRLQVELAQYRYVLSKLSGMGKSMSRLGGGIGTRGPGETQLETDRRHIRRHISRLEEEFEKIRRVRGTQRSQRVKSGIPSVAIVGYTNAGKSTLLNRLCDAGIEANDRLFDTLDPTTRKLELEDGFSALFSDTVGFIRKLPYGLIEAFKATLEELQFADLILHVIDLANPNWENHVEIVENLIGELKVSETPRIRVYNKSDIAEDTPALRGSDVCVSAKTGAGVEILLEAVKKEVAPPLRRFVWHIPYSESSAVDLLYRDAKVENVEYTDECVLVAAVCDEKIAGRLRERGITFDS